MSHFHWGMHWPLICPMRLFSLTHNLPNMMKIQNSNSTLQRSYSLGFLQRLSASLTYIIPTIPSLSHRLHSHPNLLQLLKHLVLNISTKDRVMDFHSLARKELQALCKKNKIPANMTNVAMADALTALENVIFFLNTHFLSFFNLCLFGGKVLKNERNVSISMTLKFFTVHFVLLTKPIFIFFFFS